MLNVLSKLAQYTEQMDVEWTPPMIEQKLEGLAAACQKNSVRRLALFGSALSSPEAGDLDFLVEFQEMRPVQRADCYFSL